MLGAPFDNGRVAQRVVHVDHDADAGVGAGELLDGDDGRREVHAGAAVVFGDFDAHEALLKELLDEGRVHGFGLVHFAGLGQDEVCGEFGDGLGHGGFDFGEVGDWRGGDVGDVDGGLSGDCGGEVAEGAVERG